MCQFNFLEIAGAASNFKEVTERWRNHRKMEEPLANGGKNTQLKKRQIETSATRDKYEVPIYEYSIL